MARLLFFAAILHLLCLTSTVLARPHPPAYNLIETRQAQNDGGRLVFCHFMMGVVSLRKSAADYADDMARAAAAGIDAFALNIGVDEYTASQLDYAYDAAAAQGSIKVFISFDFNWFSSTSDATKVGQMIAKYASHPGQLIVDNGRVFASSFAGDGVDDAALRAAAGVDVYWAPNYKVGTNFDNIDGALNWMAWPNNGRNRAPDGSTNLTVEHGDDAYRAALGNKDLIAPMSPWFFTHFGPEVSYSKNWLFPGEFLWYDRWTEVLATGPRFIEIITWNDYGESHYIGPLSSSHTDDGSSKWTNDMPHDGWLEMARPFIDAFHAGADSPDSYVTEDKLVYWYRPTLAEINCDDTDTTMLDATSVDGSYTKGRPDGWQSISDSVFVVTMLKEAGSVTVKSGDKEQTFEAPAGVSAHSVDMGVGQQQFTLSRGGATVINGISLRDVSDVCPCGIYNFNAFVGSLSANGANEPPSALQGEALASFTAGLRVATCEPKPSLRQEAPAAPEPTTPPPPSPPSSPPTDKENTGPITSKRSTAKDAQDGSNSTLPPPRDGNDEGRDTRMASGSSDEQSATDDNDNNSKTPSNPETTSVPEPETPEEPEKPAPSTAVGRAPASSTVAKPAPSPTPTPSAKPTPTPSPPSNVDEDKDNDGDNAGGANVCVEGTGSGNYLGLCEFSCMYGYCPPGPCTCTKQGKQIPEPAKQNKSGKPLPSLDQSYFGLCAFSCDRGYCPSTACTLA